ncbi:MAG: hypothetical protein NC390_05680 [Fusobacterium sp.]|nr:hypothetical protein [Fusobacterium sp.]
MGIDKVELKRDAIALNNQKYGLNADGTRPTEEFFTGTNMAFMGAGAAMPVWQHKGKIGEAWKNRSWQNFGNAYKTGANNAWTTFRHPMNYFDVEFVNSKVAKMESLISSNTPTMPKKAKFDAATQELFKKLCEAKNPEEFNKLIGKKGSDTYKQYKKLLKHLPTEEANKLKNVAKYNELYGELLKDYKTAQKQMQSGKLGKGRLDALHRRFAQARQAENKYITAAQKGKAGAKAVAKTGARMSKGVKNAMAASKTLRKFTRGAGKAGGWLAAGLSIVGAALDIGTAVAASPKGEGLKNGLRQAGKSAVRVGAELGGAAIGQWAGAAIGQVLIPIPGVGAAIGGIVGSFVGMWAGSKLADNIPYTEKTVAEEIEEKQLEEENKQACQAIEDDDLESVYNYSSQFKEQVVDEQGNAVVDENGIPVVQIAKVYDDEKQQKEFEKRVASLDNYVETEVTKQQRAEELKQEAELERQQQQYYAQSGSYGYTPSFGTGTGYFGTTIPSYNFGSTTNKGYYDFGTGAPATGSTYSWQNPAWQNSLGQRFDSQDFYSFNPSNYSMPWMFQQNKGYAA